MKKQLNCQGNFDTRQWGFNMPTTRHTYYIEIITDMT